MIVAVAGCLKDNNFRVCQGALSVLGALVVEMGEEFRPYVATVRRTAQARLCLSLCLPVSLSPCRPVACVSVSVFVSVSVSVSVF